MFIPNSSERLIDFVNYHNNFYVFYFELINNFGVIVPIKFIVKHYLLEKVPYAWGKPSMNLKKLCFQYLRVFDIIKEY